jgi:AraC-like DNA-binding protein
MQVYDIPIDALERETTQHGTPDFPLAAYTTTISRNVLGFINWHWHDELQLCLVREGLVEFRVRAAALCLGPGQGIFVNSRELHSARNLEGQDSTYYCLDFSANLLLHAGESLIDRTYVLPYVAHRGLPYVALDGTAAWHTTALGQLATAIHELEKPEPDRLEVFICLLQVWHGLYANVFRLDGQEAPKDTRSWGTAFEVVRYLEQNYQQDLRLRDVALACGYSQSTVTRAFRKSMGTTFADYLLNYRIEQSQRLLTSTDLPVGEVAARTGFGSASYFDLRFRDRTGMTPTAFRRARGAAG